MAPKSEVLGIYETPDQAADAIARLRATGFDENDFEVLSSTPYPEGAFGEKHVKHRLFAFPFAGAACGLAVGVAWVIGAQVSLPIITGGKPVIAMPAIIQILYEGTMLGAVLFTILGVLFESRLPDGIGLYDNRIADGYIGVSVMAAERRFVEVQVALEQAKPVDIVAKQGSLLRPAPRSASS
ncbi:MAG: DUF3341 domain-containing protein [Actinobacteria bacterium]|nr:DUF3341 domain-containing protein [Actinomycetota bacterium]